MKPSRLFHAGAVRSVSIGRERGQRVLVPFAIVVALLSAACSVGDVTGSPPLPPASPTLSAPRSATPPVTPSATPAHGTFTAAGRSLFLYEDSAFVAGDGRLVVLSQGLDQAQVFDPATWSFSALALPPVPANSWALAAGDGKIWAVAPDWSVNVVDLEQGRVEPAGRLVGERYGSTVSLRDGRVLLAGGTDSSFRYLATAEIYDPATGSSSFTGSMAVAREGFVTALLPDGRVLVAGGDRGLGPDEDILDGAEIYDPASGEFSPTGAMLQPRTEACSVVLADGRVLVVGGVGAGTEALASAEVYDPATGRFSAVGSMSTPRTRFTATPLADGRVLVAGGDQEGAPFLSTAELFDPATAFFAPTGRMLEPRGWHSADLLPDGRVLIMGGQNGDEYLQSAELYWP